MRTYDALLHHLQAVSTALEAAGRALDRALPDMGLLGLSERHEAQHVAERLEALTADVDSLLERVEREAAQATDDEQKGEPDAW